MSEQRDMQTPADGCCGDAAIYLLGLLDDARSDAFLEHARGCVVCRDELSALQPAVDILPATVPQVSAPAHVKQSVMAAVRSEARSEARAVGEARQVDRDARLGGEGRLVGEASFDRERRPGSEAGLDREARPPRSAGRRRPRLLQRATTRRPALALAAAALVAGGIAIGALSSETSGGSARVVSAAVTIAGASAALHQSGGHTWLTVAGMPQPRAGHVYEVWFKRTGAPAQPTSSLFTPTTAGTATAAVPGDLAGASEVMVTQEPAGGSRSPTSSPVIVAHLT